MPDDEELLWAFLREQAGLEADPAGDDGGWTLSNGNLLAVLDATSTALAALSRLISVTERVVNEKRELVRGARVASPGLAPSEAGASGDEAPARHDRGRRDGDTGATRITLTY